MKKILLISVMAIAGIGGAFAADEVVDTNTFPGSGYMKPTNGKSTNYIGAATEDHIGTSSGNVTASAYYEVLPGYYLKKRSYETAVCPSGSYCPGTAAAGYGLTDQIRTDCPSPYTKSDEGSVSSFYCYRDCTDSDIATHGTGFVSGGRYYNGVNMCWTSGCAAGYALTTDIQEAIYNHGAVSSSWTSSSGTPSANGATLHSAMASDHKEYWAVDFGDSGILYGGAAVGTNSEKLLAPDATFTTGSNQNCFCNITGYIDVPTQTEDSAHTYQNLAMTSAWVNIGTTSSSTILSECLAACKTLMAGGVSDDRSLLFQYRSSPRYCKARYYDVTFDGNGGTWQGITTYTDRMEFGSALPAMGSMPTRRGYRFVGYWDAATGGNQYYSGTGSPIAGKTWDKTVESPVLYAHWTKRAITINWLGVLSIPEGYDFEPIENNATYSYVDIGDNIVTPSAPLPNDAGKTFKGWRFVKPSGN